MWSSLCLQILTLLPPAADTGSVEPDSVYRNQLQALVSRTTWVEERLQPLRPQEPGHDAVLISMLERGSDAEVRLAALLAAGTSGDSPLGLALWRRAAQDFEEARVLACLLAPSTVPAEALPSLAFLASDPSRSLPQRAAACARLLDADVLTAWPLADAILRTGTASDREAGIADWRRGGRYELPKRILLLAVQDLLRRHDLEPTSFEPNGSWKSQEKALDALQPTVDGLRGQEFATPPRLRPWLALEKQVERGQPVAIRARRLLGQL